MVDVDGVIAIAPDGRRWDADIEADQGIRIADLQTHLFGARFQDCVLGRAALEDVLAQVLPVIAPSVTPAALMDYWFAKDARLDQTLLDDLAAARDGGLPMYLATIQEHRRADYLMTTLGLAQRFDGCFHSARIGARKPDRAYYDAVAAQLALPPGSLLLIDDGAGNVDGARAAGWRAELWTTGESVLRDILARHGA